MESFSAIWRNKLLFVFLLVLQILFFGVIFYSSSVYLPRMLEGAKSMSDYMQQQKFDDVSVAKNLMQQKKIQGEDPLSMDRSFNNVVYNFRIYLIWMFASLVIFMSLNWALAGMLMHRLGFKQFLRSYFRNFIVLAFCFGLVFLFFFSVLNISFAEAAFEGSRLFLKYVPFLAFSIALFYFMLVSISLTKFSDSRDILQKTLGTGIKKIHYLLSAYLIILFFIIGSLIAADYFIDTNFAAVIISALVFLFSFVVGRIFVIALVNNLESV